MEEATHKQSNKTVERIIAKSEDSFENNAESKLVIALQVPAEIWEIILEYTKFAESRLHADHLRICKALYFPALRALYKSVELSLEQPQQQEGLIPGSGHKMILGSGHKARLSLKYAKNVYFVPGKPQAGGQETSADPDGAQAIPSALAKFVVTMMGEFQHISFLSIDFEGLAAASHVDLTIIFQQMVRTQQLRAVELRSLHSGYLIPLLSGLRYGRALLPQLTIDNPLDLVEFPQAVTLLKVAIVPIQSLSIGLPRHIATEDALLAFGAFLSFFTAPGELKHLKIAAFYSDAHVDGSKLFAIAVEHGATLECLDFGIAADFEEDGAIDDKGDKTDVSSAKVNNLSRNFGGLINLTNLTLSCSWFFELPSTFLPPNLRHFTAKAYQGPLDTVMACLEKKDWLPHLRTFDLTFHPKHPNIEEVQSIGEEESYDVWLEKDSISLLSSASQTLAEHIRQHGRPLSDLANVATAFCQKRDVRQQFPDYFFKCE